MDINVAKQQVIDAGNRLVEKGLIARTWGNVSCKVDDKHFVITPSGKAYDSLTPADIVLVDIETLAYDGDVKPSSEKGVHAEVYKARKDAGFVIHTHQTYASVISVLDTGIANVDARFAPLVGNTVPIGGYGMPSTGKLIKGVAAGLQKTNGNAVIMAHHGAICFAADSEQTFAVAAALEDACEAYLWERFAKKYGEPQGERGDFAQSVMEKMGFLKEGLAKSDSLCYTGTCNRDKGTCIVKCSDDRTTTYNLDADLSASGDSLAPVARLFQAIFQNRDDISYIKWSGEAAITAVSAMGKTMKPQLDDLAQIIGTDVKCVDAKASPAAVVKALKKRHAVQIVGQGALCCGKNESDATAVEMILTKGCLSLAGSLLLQSNNVISALECKLMRFIYLTKYSKKQ